MVYILMIISVLLGNFSTVLQKNYTIKTSGIKTALNLYMLICHPIAAIYYFCMAKGNIPLNFPTFIFSFCYAFVCIASVVLSMLAFSRISLIYISVFSGAGGVIIPFLFELIFRDEAFSIFHICSVIMRILAVLSPLILSKKYSGEFRGGLLICVLLFLNGGLATIIPKLFAEYPKSLSANTFCFWTNIIIVPVLTIYILKKDGIKSLKCDIKKIKPSVLSYVFTGTAFNNINSVISLYTLKFISATFKSVFTSSFSMIVTVFISRFIYKETISKPMVVSVIFSILAVIIGVWG